MNQRQSILGVASILLWSSVSIAGEMGPIAESWWFHPVVSLQGGYASTKAGGSQNFNGFESETFIYNNSDIGKNSGFIGVFLGSENFLPLITSFNFYMQTGIEYNYFGKVSVTGVNSVVSSQTSTNYNYNYNFQTQQILGTLKLFTITYQRFYPYIEFGMGVAFNHNGKYQALTNETGNINPTPYFASHNNTQFSYIVGFGSDMQIAKKIRVGLGYRYSDFGQSSLGNGSFTSSNIPVPFTLGSSNALANQLLARISYIA